MPRGQFDQPVIDDLKQRRCAVLHRADLLLRHGGERRLGLVCDAKHNQWLAYCACCLLHLLDLQRRAWAAWGLGQERAGQAQALCS